MNARTLVVGVGNPIRGDDAAGIEVARRIAALDLPGVEVWTVHQLQVELVQHLRRFDRFMVVDASIRGDPVALGRIDPDDARAAGASHGLPVSALVALSRSLHGSSPEAMLCTLRGEHFGFVDTLSGEMAGRVNAAVERIVHWISAG
jgi:hydrogenase maturation protease